MHLATMSNHAEQRMAQRGFTSEAIETLISYGNCRRRRGADIYFMDHEARRRALDGLGAKRFARLEKTFNSYLVVSDEAVVITCAKRLKRLI